MTKTATVKRQPENVQICMSDCSMQPEIKPGDTLVIEKNSKLMDGNISLVLVGDTPLIRKVCIYDEGVILTPLNTERCKPLNCPNSCEITCLGHVKQIIRDLC